MSDASHKPKNFITTQWSIVLAAGHQSTLQSQEALATLCKNYWSPIYSYVRSRAHDTEEAKDLTQEFFVKLLDKKYLKDVKPELGKFRSFLLTSVKNFLANQRDYANAQKRGGGQLLISLDLEFTDSNLRFEPSHNLTPEKYYERQWVLVLLDRVIDQLRAEFVEAGKEQRFNLLKEYLTKDGTDIPYSEVAKELAMQEGAVKVAVHRLRKRFGEILREEVTKTLANPDDVEDEIQELFSALEP